MAIELALVVFGALVAAGLVARGAFRSGLVLAVLCLAAVGAGALIWTPGGDEVLAASLPTPREKSNYVTSDVCQSCHPGAYHAWKNSFHRTMTQAATPESVLGDFDDLTLSSRGHEIRLERRGRTYWAALPDPLWFQDSSPDKISTPPRIQARIVMTTGSHHLQYYWLRRPDSGPVYRDSHDNGALVQLPFVWIIETGRWVPAQDSFLTPYSPDPEPTVVWNTSCHVCHSVATTPGFDDGDFDTASVELGIACEACHGPGGAHVEHYQNPWRRYVAYWTDEREADPLIQNPERLDSDWSVETCGQCHSFSRIVDIPKWKREGLDYQPGEPLAPIKSMLRYSAAPKDPHLLAQLEQEPNALVGRFWADGTIRVAGREMNGIVESACYESGDLTCLSCHSMHRYESASDQLIAGGRGNGPCLTCHTRLPEDISKHTLHASASSGSLCMNCHMPHTTYGLFKAIRSHRIDNPSVAKSVVTGRPNACNLCHLDKSLAWTNRELARGWDVAAVSLPEENREVAASVQWALAGDAAQRAIVAWHMGWGPAQTASGAGWVGLYLGQLLSDPYAAVREVAHRSISRLPGFEDFEYDYLAEPAERAAKSREAWDRWARTPLQDPSEERAALLLGPKRDVDRATFSRLLRAQDHTPLRIIE